MIYFIQAEGLGHIKIGFTDHDDTLQRLVQLQTGSPVPLRLLGTIPGTLNDEKTLHRRFASDRVQGEWFKPSTKLLALASPSDPLRCGANAVVSRSIQIQVLTVGRKQFTTRMLDQLPRLSEPPFNVMTLWEETESYAREGKDPQQAAKGVHDLRLDEETDYWGWVWGDWSHLRSSRQRKRILLFQQEDLLHRCTCILLRNELPEWFYPQGSDQLVQQILSLVWQRCFEHWFGEARHLYSGV